MLTAESVSRLFSNFDKLRVLIVGDVMIDSYLFGTVDRISPEAPVPVVAVKERSERLGGAANVALNIKALGSEAVICTVVGKDDRAMIFEKLLKSHQMPVNGLVRSDNRITTTKFRVIGNKVQMLRVDEEDTAELNQTETQQLLDRFEYLLQTEHFDAVVLQDYNKGVLTTEVISKVIERATKHKIPVTVDPKKKNFLAYQGATLFKPNLKELREGLGKTFSAGNFDELFREVAALQDEMKVQNIMVTLSEKGVIIRHMAKSENIEIHIPAHLRNISDVSGAGDTVISVATLCLAMDQEPATIAAIANLAGGLVCEEVGVVPIDKNKLHDEVLRLLVR
jgi:D-glycero-beta-D-manno-heptose-7-phosphate kinase